jgi:eukaryotic-like serine/threonine-protein kinase
VAAPRASTAASAALVAAGAAVVVLGALLGWTATRAIGGQSPLTTLNVTTTAAQTVVQHDLGYAIPVPLGWTPYVGPDSVSYVSKDRTEELRVQRVASVTAGQDVGGAELVEAPATSPDGPPEAVRLSYRTADRTTWRKVVKDGDHAWTISLTVPRDAAGRLSEEFLTYLASRFTPPA